ncbi:MAG TPA: sigma-70 family RNA polymerase sigma factor [Chloroflexota bacterium]|nr:sigma-70 family RNA polymerase sigma factor [Chloroflexota bacterium]
MSAPAATLVRGAVAGDRVAFAALVTPCLPDLNRLCRRLAGPALAEDCVQDALMLALVRLAALRDPEAFPWWLRGIAIRVCRRARARLSPHVPLPAVDELDAARIGDHCAEPSLDERLASQDLVRGVRAAVAALPPGQRAAVELFYLRGLSYDETGAALGVPVGAVKTRLHKARAALAFHFRLGDGPCWRPDDRTLAVHEAGHAVLGWLAGDTVLRIAITPRAAANYGFVRAAEPTGGTAPATRLAMLMAGEAAVARALPRSRPRADSGDRAAAARVARAATGGDDVEAALALSGALAAARARLEDARTWALVERVAAALTARRALDADEFRTLVTA